MAEPVPQEEDFTWKEFGACNAVDPALFFPGRGESTEQAKAVCRSCLVLEECRSWAIPNERFGVWGALSERERRRLRRQMRRTGQLPPLPAASGSVVDLAD